MPRGTVQPKQRVMAADVPGFSGLRSALAAAIHAAPARPPRLNTQLWSMPQPYPGSVTLSSLNS
jgi:hypothetical protein